MTKCVHGVRMHGRACVRERAGSPSLRADNNTAEEWMARTAVRGVLVVEVRHGGAEDHARLRPVGEEVVAREAHVGLLALVPRLVHKGEREAMSLLGLHEVAHAILPASLGRTAARLSLVQVLHPCVCA